MDMEKIKSEGGGLFLPILSGVVAFIAVYAWREGSVGAGAFFVLLVLGGFLFVVRAMAVRAEVVNKGEETVTEAPAAAHVAPAAPAPKPAPKPAPAPATAAPTAAASADEGVGKRPVMLESARGGHADDLKMIKGVGPRLEKLLHRLGFFHFDQIANWTPDEVAWVDEHLEGFKGRVSRDNWVAQAKILSGGGETEFSRRVEEGEVYE